MKCSGCHVENETVRLRQGHKVIKNDSDRRLHDKLGVRLNKHLCDECWHKWNKETLK